MAAVQPFNYASARDDADELLTEFGQAVTVRKVTNNGGPDYAPTQSTTDYATVACILDLARWYPPTLVNTDILRTDRSALIAAGPLTALGVGVAKMDLIILSDGTVYRVVDVKPASPAGLVLCYNCWVRI